MDGCVFCGIVSGKIPAKIAYQDEQIVVFPDIKPKAKIHYLLASKRHLPDFLGAPEEVVRAIFEEISRLVQENNLIEKGYRLVVNGGTAKMVPHAHVHLLGEVSVDKEV